MKKIVLLLSVFIFSSGLCLSQTDFPVAEEDLARYNDWFVNSDKYEHRLYAHTMFESLIREVMKEDNSFSYPFDSLKWVSKIMAPDFSFRILTWQLNITDTDVRYSGIFQTDKGIFYLEDNGWQDHDIDYDEFSENNWYGQVYYNLHHYREGDNVNYLLFGHRQLKSGDRIKVAEIVTIGDDGIKFGKAVFEDPKNIGLFKNRIVHRTSFESSSRLNYMPDFSIIIYDHTMSVPASREPGAKMITVADGTYHGYERAGEKWKFIDNAFPDDGIIRRR